MYVGEGTSGAPTARFYRTDDAAGAAVFTDMTTIAEMRTTARVSAGTTMSFTRRQVIRTPCISVARSTMGPTDSRQTAAAFSARPMLERRSPT